MRPTIIRIEVDLPAPFGPRKPVTRPAGATKLMSSTTVVARYFLDRESMVIMVDRLPVSIPARWFMALLLGWLTACLNARNAAASARRREVALGSDQPMSCGPTQVGLGPGTRARSAWALGSVRGASAASKRPVW